MNPMQTGTMAGRPAVTVRLHHSCRPSPANDRKSFLPELVAAPARGRPPLPGFAVRWWYIDCHLGCASTNRPPTGHPGLLCCCIRPSYQLWQEHLCSYWPVDGRSIGNGRHFGCMVSSFPQLYLGCGLLIWHHWWTPSTSAFRAGVVRSSPQAAVPTHQCHPRRKGGLCDGCYSLLQDHCGQHWCKAVGFHLDWWQHVPWKPMQGSLGAGMLG